MKVCKKCKKQVANKTKICKYCGADVSKCKIIKKPSDNTNKKLDIKEVKPELKKEDVITLNNNNVNNKDKKQNKDSNKKSKINGNKKSKSKKFDDIKNKKTLKTNDKKEKQKVYKKNKKVLGKGNKVKKSCKFKVYSDKLLIIISFILLFLLIILIGGFFLIEIFDLSFVYDEKDIMIKEKATNDKVFAIGDMITYNNAYYVVDGVEVSKGNSYKSPKEGNQFLIVTVSIYNNDDKKIPYSYENWTMTNSLKEEKRLIFTSINVDNALYSGLLDVDGVKTGSMVFEQPIDDDKLRLNFYELLEDENGNDKINKDKKVFSVSIKVPDDKDSNDLDKKKYKDVNKD